jgi:3-phenylpropionate/trans-cinnamate dioxygenase ferredoxin subunit
MCERPISVAEDRQGEGGAPQPQWLPVCSFSQLAAGTIVAARVGGIDLLVVDDQGRPVACERACPHEQADLAAGRVVAGRLFCPRHAASFSLTDGAISSGWPSRALRIYPVRIDHDQVFVDASCGVSARSALRS